jgi:hypothetical protein
LKGNTEKGIGGSFDMTEELGGNSSAAEKSDDLEENLPIDWLL